jgi:hypothetical protein
MDLIHQFSTANDVLWAAKLGTNFSLQVFFDVFSF